MKKLFFTLLFFLFTLSSVVLASNPLAINGLLQRIFPTANDATRFECSIAPAADDYFILSSDGKTVNIVGRDNVCIATGINYFLQHKVGIDISWNNPTATLPSSWKAFTEEGHVSSVPYRYYLNFCTHSYTMAFWDWERWQREIDWMALHGVNMPLILQGMECVWKTTLEHYGYDLSKVNKFLSGNAYYGWFFMNNMTEFGGPMPESWYTKRQLLGRQIMGRLQEFGMQPVVPGYVGMIPHHFLQEATKNVEHWKSSDITYGGHWCQFERPYIVKNIERLKEFASVYYDAMKKVYGNEFKTHFYDIDPFHEGGKPEGITTQEANQMVRAMWDALLQHDTKATWVAQHWQSNPRNWVTKNIPAGRLLILNLHGDSHGRTDLYGEQRDDAKGKHHEWVWGMTSNFGGNVGLFGRLQRMVNTFHTALANSKENGLRGIGAIPEGIENNNVLYDLLYTLPWMPAEYNLQQYIDDYIYMRYGVNSETDKATFDELRAIWKILANGIYNCQSDGQQGTTESVFMMRPQDNPATVSSWAGSSWYWDIDELRYAALRMLRLAPRLKHSDNYRYDLVDIMRQTLADYGMQTLQKRANATTVDERKQIESQFLDMILTQDTLMGTRKEWRLGTWIDMARAYGTTTAEKDLQEKNARMLLTTWGGKQQCNGGGLHDYANREWNGLLAAYYYPRWKAYFKQHRNSADYLFDNFEWPFAMGEKNTISNYLPSPSPYAYNTFSSQAKGDEIEMAEHVWHKYFSSFRPVVWEHKSLDPNKDYVLLNVTPWNGSPSKTQGFCWLERNADWNKSCRLQHLPLQSTVDFKWRFVPVEEKTDVYKLLSVGLQAKGDAKCYLTSIPSSIGYPVFTFSEKGSEYEVYEKKGKCYIRDAKREVFMRPDIRYTCVLLSTSLVNDGLLYILPAEDIEEENLNAMIDESKYYTITFKRGQAAVGVYGAFANAAGEIDQSANSRRVTTAIPSDEHYDLMGARLWQFEKNGAQSFLVNGNTRFYVGNVDKNDGNNLVTTQRKEWARSYYIPINDKGECIAVDPTIDNPLNTLNSYYNSKNPKSRQVAYWKNGFKDEGNIFFVEELKSLPLQIESSFLTTFAYPVALEVPTTPYIYIGKGVEKGKMQLQRLQPGTIIPPGTPCIVVGIPGHYTLQVKYGEKMSPRLVADKSIEKDEVVSLLQSVYAERRHVASGTVLLLQRKGDKAVWAINSDTQTLKPNSIFLPAKAVGQIEEVEMPDEINNFITAIVQNTQSESKDSIYNIEGKKISISDTGIYLVGGKKVLYSRP